MPGGERAVSPPDPEQALRRLLPRVRNLVRYLVRGDTDVDDIAQQALIAIARGLPTWRQEAPLERWADRVTARATFAELRRRRTEAARQVSDDGALEQVESGEAGPEAVVLRREAVRALDALPEEQRSVIVLHHVVGLSLPEVAEELGIPHETARSRMRLGIQKLRARVEVTS